MKYPKEYLDEIKLRLKVSQIVGKTVQLKKRGKEFIGLSPFKNEKTPSFTVNDEKEFIIALALNMQYFDFLMKTKSVGFGEAVRTLAAEAGMQPYRFSNFDEKDLGLRLIKIYLKSIKIILIKIYTVAATKSLRLSPNRVKRYTVKNLSGYVPWKNDFTIHCKIIRRNKFNRTIL